MKERLTIAMDGPAGSGKSTIAQRLAEKLDYLYLNSGSMYRAMTLLSIREGGRSDECADANQASEELPD